MQDEANDAMGEGLDKAGELGDKAKDAAKGLIGGLSLIHI